MMTATDWLWSLRHWNTGRSTLSADEADAIASLWEADIARREAAERALADIECVECEHDLLHCTCLGGLCFEEKP